MNSNDSGARGGSGLGRHALEELRVDQIEVVPELYPRRRHQDRTVAQYRQALDLLPPIDVVRKDGRIVLVDGYHRLLAHRLEGRQTIAAKTVQAKDILVEAIRRNAAHGYQLEDADKATCARLLYGREENPIKDEGKLASLLGVGERAVRGYLADIKRKEKDARNARIRELWLDCYSQEEIAEEVGIPVQTVNDQLPKKEQLPKSEDAPASLQSWTLWDEWQDCDERFGCAYPGRMPGQVIENLLYYLTEPGDAVLDPMAGSGTTRDVCQAMGRRCFSSDGYPLQGKSFIRKHVIPVGGTLPEVPGTVARQKGFRLIVLDPPYWRQADYGDRHGIIGAREGFAEYVERVSAIIGRALGAVRPGGSVAVIASSTTESGKVYDPVPVWEANALGEGAQLWDRVIVPYTSQRATGEQVAAARKNKMLLRRHRDLVVLQRKGSS